MSYLVKIRRTAQSYLDQLSKHDYEAITNLLMTLKEEPRPSGVKKLSGSGLWRIRVKDYRIIFAVDDRQSVVLVVRIARRSEGTYKGL